MEVFEETEDLSLLTNSVKDLIDGYEQAETLLESQIKAVVSNDSEAMNQLISTQLDHYEKLSKLEGIFRNYLSDAYGKVDSKETQPKLSRLLKFYQGKAGRLSAMRLDLIGKVEGVKTLSLRLLDLLKFAQDLNVDTLKAIMTAVGKHDVHYDQHGKTGNSSLAHLSIDQKG